ncbi:MAG TPA: hypothetical protein VGN97_16340 [Mesorhizobium sp.]|jgi:hypothetical protein|nr:hypothetical protein [Mesorhizobium sp.]
MSNEQETDVVTDEQDQDEDVGGYVETGDALRRESLLEHIGRAARENPASAALIAAGLVWIAFGGARNVARGANIAGAAVGDAARAAASTATQAARAVGDVVATGAENAQEAAARAGKSVTRTVRASVGAADRAAAKSGDVASRETSRAGDYVQGAAKRTSSALSQAGQGIAGGLRDSATAVQRGGERARRAAGDLADQPLLLSALCLAAGAGAAALLPRTRRESELLGFYREEAVQATKRGAVRLVAGGVRTARAKTSEAVQEAARKAAEEAAERVLRQADSIGGAVLDSLQRVTGDLGAEEKPTGDEGRGTQAT